MNEQDLLKIVCPKCQCIGQFYQHGSYVRFLFVIIQLVNFISKDRIRLTVYRIKCKNCGKTHAILDRNIIPYRAYSLPFVLKVLKRFFIDNKKSEEVYTEFDISDYVFKMFLSYYSREQIDLKSYFKNGALTEKESFIKLIAMDVSAFLKSFFDCTHRYFFFFLPSGTISVFRNRSFHITMMDV